MSECSGANLDKIGQIGPYRTIYDRGGPWRTGRTRGVPRVLLDDLALMLEDSEVAGVGTP